ncbi:MAG: hypothetical protein E7019_00100 [Alphaproteobacteria bacterium]|nr:hypothetical protein [Alphaproteobacteria bacterium]
MNTLIIILGVIVVIFYSYKDIFFSVVKVYDISKAEEDCEYNCKFRWRGKERDGVFVAEPFDLEEHKEFYCVVKSLICDEGRWYVEPCTEDVKQN